MSRALLLNFVPPVTFFVNISAELTALIKSDERYLIIHYYTVHLNTILQPLKHMLKYRKRLE